MAWRWKDSLPPTSRGRKLVERHPARAGEGSVLSMTALPYALACPQSPPRSVRTKKAPHRREMGDGVRSPSVSVGSRHHRHHAPRRSRAHYGALLLSRAGFSSSEDIC